MILCLLKKNVRVKLSECDWHESILCVQDTFTTARKGSWKVMFLHLSVILFTWGWCHPWGCHPYVVPPLEGGSMMSLWMEPPPTYGWQADGTHPTGMLSCLQMLPC